MDDLISRQDAIDTLNIGAELLRRVLDETDIVGAEREKYGWGLGLIESYISDIKELPSAQQWIPVSSNPITTGLYLVLCNEWGHNRYRICAYYGEAGKWIENGKNITKSITYWMPLPEPWEGGAEMKGERNECID